MCVNALTTIKEINHPSVLRMHAWRMRQTRHCLTCAGLLPEDKIETHGPKTEWSGTDLGGLADRNGFPIGSGSLLFSNRRGGAGFSPSLFPQLRGERAS